MAKLSDSQMAFLQSAADCSQSDEVAVMSRRGNCSTLTRLVSVG